MKISVGLDIGGSTTKVVGFDGSRLVHVEAVNGSDPVTAAYGGLGKFLESNALHLDDLARICITGVGSSYITGNIMEKPTIIVPEFESVGLGGLYVSDCQEALIVSMGTGTSFVAARQNKHHHVIGSGVGGGTLIGLAKKMLNISEIDSINDLAEHGNVSNIDLSIGDISSVKIPGLSLEVTASNFGKSKETATREDIAIGIINLVFQSIGTAAVLSARLENLNTIVLTGNLMRIKLGQAVLQLFSDLYNISVIIPEKGEFATAIGAALIGTKD